MGVGKGIFELFEGIDEDDFWSGVPVPRFAKDVVADGWGVSGAVLEGYLGGCGRDHLGDHAFGSGELVDAGVETRLRVRSIQMPQQGVAVQDVLLKANIDLRDVKNRVVPILGRRWTAPLRSLAADLLLDAGRAQWMVDGSAVALPVGLRARVQVLAQQRLQGRNLRALRLLVNRIQVGQGDPQPASFGAGILVTPFGQANGYQGLDLQQVRVAGRAGAEV